MFLETMFAGNISSRSQYRSVHIIIIIIIADVTEEYMTFIVRVDESTKQETST
jgi:hypothetical protein